MLKNFITDAITSLFYALEYINKNERESDEANKLLFEENLKKNIENNISNILGKKRGRFTFIRCFTI